MPTWKALTELFRKNRRGATGDGGHSHMLFRTEAHTLPILIPDFSIDVNYITMGICTSSPDTSTAAAIPTGVKVTFGGETVILPMDGLDHVVGAG